MDHLATRDHEANDARSSVEEVECGERDRLNVRREVAEDYGCRPDSASSVSSTSTGALLASVPLPANLLPTGADLPNLTEFRSEVGTTPSESDHDSFDDSSRSSWSYDSISGALPERHVRGTRGSLPRPLMPDWSPPSTTTVTKAVPDASAISTDSTDSACGPASQSPIRRKRQSAWRRPRRMESNSVRERSFARTADQACVEVSPSCLDFGKVVQWCRRTCGVSIHNRSRFTAKLHGGIIANGSEGAASYALQLLDHGWPTLPPMSTAVLQVDLVPSTVGPCAATLVVHATTDGAGSAPVAAVCELRGSCDHSPLRLTLEHENQNTPDNVGPQSLRLENTSERPADLSITADEPYETQASSLTLHPGEVHLTMIKCASTTHDSNQVRQSWLKVHDTTNGNQHRLLLNKAATTSHPAACAVSHSSTLEKPPPMTALADSISARSVGRPKWYGLAGAFTQVQIEIYNAHSEPVRLLPRLKQAGHETTYTCSSNDTGATLENASPIVATPCASSTFMASICIAQAGMSTVDLQLLCTDESSVVVSLKFEVEEENWYVDGEADGLDFGTVDGYGSHFVSTQIHNRTSIPTGVRIFLDGEVEAPGGTKSLCFFAALGCPGEDIRDGNALRLESGDQIQLPPCSDITGSTGSVTLYVGLQSLDNIGHESLTECNGVLRFESVRQVEAKTASLRLHAQVGTPRLQVPGGEQLLLFCVESLTAKTSTQTVRLRNYGNVNACCDLRTTNESFRVDPQAVVIGPSEVVEVRVMFTAERRQEHTEPEQVSNAITAHLEVNTKHMLFQIPLRAEIRTHPNLVCSAPVVNWGCVELGAIQRQSIVVHNRSSFNCEIFAAVADVEGPDLSQPSPFAIEGAEMVQLNGLASHEFVLRFTPDNVSFVRHGLFIRDKFGRTYKIPLLGAGGKSCFTLELEPDERSAGLSLAQQTTSSQKTMTLHNTGTRTGFVHIDCTSVGGDVVIVGSRNAASVVVAPNKSHTFVLEFSQKCSLDGSPFRRDAALDVYCGDELVRRRRRQCRHARWSEEIACSRSALVRDAFDDTFCNEQFFVEPHPCGVPGALEDTVFDDYFDEPIFEAHLQRMSVPLIAGCRVPGSASTPNRSTTAAEKAGSVTKTKTTGEDADARMVSRTPLGEYQSENVNEGSLNSRTTANKNDEPVPTRRHPECLHTNTNELIFPPTVVGETATVQLELCNGHRREITVAGTCGAVQGMMQIKSNLSGHNESIEIVVSGTGDD